MKRGFTLIELLVVVLIIGILSAVALPQYQKAVKKARTTQAIVIARALANAEEAYYLANNEYTTDPDNLDISVTLPTDWHFHLDENMLYVTSDKFIPNSTITYFYLHQDLLPGKLVCWANNNDTAAQELCKTVGGTQIADSGGGKNWLIGG